ncbi:hypothetical protein LTR36_005907 [Oleoguttula mirabilis]|uniref:Zn(2)-C6 fungal-type domain-containing protein n=1 Tax=Oleoguttula mirabilis TaxID=1507867 RepID=A0AAV9JDD8_9PEZI|nr:hypothetical protein LTR36_005907 [Oleoguttula mirabilis]
MANTMPQDPSLHEITPARRQASPDTLAGSDRKRRRKVLSCYDCRRRKLQCDRAMPACGRCTKAGQASNCLYIDDATEGPARESDGREPFDAHISRPIQQAPTPLGDTLARLEYQDRRIKQLEAALAHTGHTQAMDPAHRLRASKLPLTPESVVGAAEQIGASMNDRETMVLRGKSFKTQFHGTTHPGALIAHIPDLNLFTKETFESFPALARIRQDMHTLEDRTDAAGSRPQSITSEQLKALLPPQDEADQLVQLYLDNYGCIYHILHLPSFRKEYSEMWSNVADARPHFVAIVLLIMAAAQCLTSTQPMLYTAKSSTAREKAITYVEACDDWLQTQSQKHVTAADFQIRCLLQLGRMVSARKIKRTWTDSGTLLRFCMAAGLHRNPDLIRKKTSALDKELRRRIWATVIELELQAAFDRGMISAQWPMQTDCSAPSNIHDDDLDQDSEQLPAMASPSEFTNASYLVTASDSVLLRHGLNNTLNNIRQALSFNDIKRFTEEIEAQIQSIPSWEGIGADAPHALLSLRLRQYLLVLHDRQVRQADNMTERGFSRMIIIDTATRIIDAHRKLVNRGCYALELMCNDQLRAALSICHVATTADINADNAIGKIIEHHADRVMDEAIQMLTDKVIRFGREQRQLWIALAAHGFWKARKDPSHRAMYMQEAVEKVTRPWYKIMACQEDAPIGALPEASRDRSSEVPHNMLGYLQPGPVLKAGAVAELGDPPLLDLDEIEAWTFENWGFNPMDLQHALADPYPPIAP